MKVLDQPFYRRPTLVVARELLGKKLVRERNGTELSGIIIETEAYLGQKDSACHAYRGRTPRNAVMFGPPGHAYVYFTYGMHFLLNLVTEEEGHPCAVLIRALEPLAGIDEMRTLRRRPKALTDGPAKLCQALAIDKTFNGWDVTKGEKLWVEKKRNVPASRVITTPRIGIDYAAPQHRNAPWRFLMAGRTRT
jgi:DNA-3-methyladenine glycosylase